MTRHSFHPLILCVLGLSITGFIYRLYSNPVALFEQAFFMVVFVAIVFLLVKKFLAHKHSTANYYRSQPQPKRVNFKASTHNNVIPHKKKKDSKKFSRPLVKKRSAVTLTVIEGKKSKKKNRALF